ncbi:AI-2E family transporter [Fluviispira multicolorata]|uniref:AI-2E family transporter n=1 Tax=Fluviispira multicolorata TaxID=2654512 RepID=A0A833N533_9BACT|nr:AI-2E family transporter [Fluviispira multicolorata]KAB8029792.1 AI-2E family transporter [Fluviispira multicolorata]
MKNNRGKIFFISFFIIFVFIFAFINIVIGPLIISFVAAYLINPVFEYLENKGINRALISFITIIILGILTFLAIWLFFPLLFNQIENLITKLPAFKNYIELNLVPKIQLLISNITGQKQYKILNIYDFIPINLENFGETLLSRIGASTRFIASLLIMTVFTPLFSYFFMRDFNKIHKQIFDLVPIDIKPIFIEFIEEVDKKLRSVLRGQSLVILILCFLYPTVFLIAGLPAAIAVGILTGISRLVPYMDILVGSFLCFFVLVTNAADSHLILSVSLAFLAVQCLDGLFITPRILGRFSGLHPSLVILSVLCFGDWFGFYGILLAIPLAAVGKVSFKLILRTYKESVFFKNGNNG